MIQFTATAALLKTLEIYGIKPTDYRPAYSGESVGLDLYNASDIAYDFPPVGGHLSDIEVFQVKVPTGIKVALPPSTVGLVLERGSVIKTPLKVRAGVLDPGYTDELFLNCVNLSSHWHRIEPNAKLPFQLVVMPAITQYCFIDTDVYDATTRYALRKTGSVGSSDKRAIDPDFPPGTRIIEVS